MLSNQISFSGRISFAKRQLGLWYLSESTLPTYTPDDFCDVVSGTGSVSGEAIASETGCSVGSDASIGAAGSVVAISDSIGAESTSAESLVDVCTDSTGAGTSGFSSIVSVEDCDALGVSALGASAVLEAMSAAIIKTQNDIKIPFQYVFLCGRRRLMNSKTINTDSAHEDIKANVTDMNSKGTTPFLKSL